LKMRGRKTYTYKVSHSGGRN